ncbi:MAG: efflux RND transporter periplasmic adaptor subunit [Thermonemataceae bacterium]|nr:efflux RND transporter periplasmic adaptor subunit [Thermonemataceae bacterium]
MKKSLFFVILALFSACQSTQNESSLEKDRNIANDAIEVNATQIKTMGIEFSKLEQSPMNEVVVANGVVDVPPESRAIVTAKMEGFVQKCDWIIGDFVQKGQELTILENSRLILLQEDYLQTKNQIIFLEQEYKRQQELLDNEAGAKKNFQKITVDLQSAKIKLASLEKQLSFVGINAKNIHINTISPRFVVVAPISGYIKSINVARGQSVLAETVLFEITSKEHLHIELQVFEKDIKKIQKGQKVYFQIPNLGEDILEGEVFLIGQNFDIESKTVNIHVHFDENKASSFLPNMYVNARIVVGNAKEWILPDASILEEGEEKIIYYTTNQKQFFAAPIKIKNRESGFSSFEFIKPIPSNALIVSKGASYLQSNTEEE